MTLVSVALSRQLAVDRQEIIAAKVDHQLAEMTGNVRQVTGEDRPLDDGAKNERQIAEATRNDRIESAVTGNDRSVRRKVEFARDDTRGRKVQRLFEIRCCHQVFHGKLGSQYRIFRIVSGRRLTTTYIFCSVLSPPLWNVTGQQD